MDKRSSPDTTDALEEGIEILTNLFESIRKHGNYSQESTLNFISQALGCFRASQPATPTGGEMTGYLDGRTPARSSAGIATQREAALEKAALDFIAKVDRGEARSKRSYDAFKAALSIPGAAQAKLDPVPTAWLVDGPAPLDSSEVFLTHDKALEAFSDWGKRITPLYAISSTEGK